MVRNATPDEKIAHDLISATRREKRCEHLIVDDISPYCGNGLENGVKGEEINSERRRVCDIPSLQLWCLDPARYGKCMYYQKPLN